MCRSLDKKKKHRIEVVVDRFKVRGDLGIRLAESFETALNLTDGLASISYMEGKNKDISFSARFACPECGHSIDELEPRLFSFNNPAGACSGCDGLGVKQFFDEERLVLFPESSLAEGAIRGWDRRNVYYFHMLNSLAEHYDFSIDTPFSQLSKRHRKSYPPVGVARKKSPFRISMTEEMSLSANTPSRVFCPIWNAVIEIQSHSQCERNCPKFLASQPCPDCHGTRLRRDARHVFVDEHNLPEHHEQCRWARLKFTSIDCNSKAAVVR